MHIHSLAKSIMSETIIEWVGQELDHAVTQLPVLREGHAEDPESALPRDFRDRADLFGPGKAGYVQALEVERIVEIVEIVEIARRADVLVGLSFQAGDFVVRGGKGIGVYPAERSSAELREQIVRTISIGAHRTPVQDRDFAIRHLVVRALSPGINDPYTAVSATNRLSASLAQLMERDLPAGVIRDDDARIRLACPRPTHASVLAAALSQIRQNGGDKPIIVLTLLDTHSSGGFANAAAFKRRR